MKTLLRILMLGPIFIVFYPISFMLYYLEDNTGLLESMILAWDTFNNKFYRKVL